MPTPRDRTIGIHKKMIVREERKATLLEQQHAEQWSKRLYDAFTAVDMAKFAASAGGSRGRLSRTNDPRTR